MFNWAIEETGTGTELQNLLQQEENARALSASDVALVAKKQQEKADQISESEEQVQSQTEQTSQTDQTQVQSQVQGQVQGQVQDSQQVQSSQVPGEEDEIDEDRSLQNSQDPEKEQVAAEHWQLATETFLGGDSLLSAGSTVATVADKAQSLTFIGYLGLTTAIAAGAVVLGGVLYAMEKTAKLLFTGIISLKDYVYRRMNSFESLHTQIKDIKAAVKAMEETKSDKVNDFDIKPTYTTVRVINNLKIEASTDFAANIQTMTKFMAGVNSEVNAAILKDLRLIGYLTELNPVAFGKLKNEGIYSQGFGSLFTKQALDGYVAESDLTEFWRSQATLPGDTALFINIPSTALTDKEQANKAFALSNCGIGIDTESFRDIDEIEYLDKAKLLVLLDRMEKLCLEALSHRQLYEAVISRKSDMRFKFKVFFAELMSTKDRVFASKKVSAVHFRMQYVDKIYLKMTMDLHDLCVKVLVNAISFAQKNATKL